MKDTAISYDPIHQHPQQDNWNHQRQQQQQQAHTTSVYTNQSTQQAITNSQSPRTNIGHQQQNQHAQLNQYHHQQLQSTAHHNSTAAAAAYYQQAHLYPNYQHAHTHTQNQQQQSQQQQQQQPTQAQHSATDHHHHPGSNVTTTPSTASVSHHHQQNASNTQASVLNHTGWSPSIASMAPQAHHAVVTDHSTLAYITHTYQSHNTSVADHHRNTDGPIGAAHQASSYSVDSMYNSPAAAAAVAAYGYNNYNAAAFFQTSNDGQHTQTGHPTTANISNFWNHNQTPQQRSTHTQPVANQSTIQQRQSMASDQSANYIHDPRMYYGRPAATAAYGQSLQNFGQSHHSQPQDVLHQRMTNISQQHQLLHHHDQIHQVSHQQLHVSQSNMGNHHQAVDNLGQASFVEQQQQQHTQHQQQQQQSSQQQPQSNQSFQASPSPTTGSSQNVKQLSTNKTMVQNQQTTKQPANDLESVGLPAGQVKKQSEFDCTNASPLQSQTNQAPQTATLSSKTTEPSESDSLKLSSSKDSGQQSTLSSNPLSPNTKSVIKSGPTAQYQRKINAPTGTQSQTSSRAVYRPPNDDRSKTQLNEPNKKVVSTKDLKISPLDIKDQETTQYNRSPENSANPSLEDGMATLNIASRKTTWASIASQPAKVAQPKSLKTKIAGSNSVLSTAKHLTAVSLDSSSIDSKNGINPAIKNSVSAASSIQRGSVPPPISKIAAVAASMKLDILGEEGLETSKISWPAMNASLDLTLDDPPLQKETASKPILENINNDRIRRDDNYKTRDYSMRDHNHNQGSNMKMVNQYAPSYGPYRDYWGRREQRDFRVRRDSDRKESEFDRKTNHIDEPRESNNLKRDFKNTGRPTTFRGDDHYRDNKRGTMLDRNDHRNDGYQSSRSSSGRYESRDMRHLNIKEPLGNRRENDNHHHNNNYDERQTRVNSALKPEPGPQLNPENFNPKGFDLEPTNARYFIIKSYSEDDIHRSIKYSIWCSTNHGNKRLDEAYRQQQAKNGLLYLFFSVNGSGHFCGMAQMTSSVDFDSSSGVWAQSKWQGEFSVKWIYVKDVPNSALRHITLENNEDKPVTNSRDTQEVPSEKGKAVLRILHQYPHTTSLFDDFSHYERRQEEEKFKKAHVDHIPHRPEERDRGSRFNRSHVNSRPHNDFQPNRDRSSRFAS